MIEAILLAFAHVFSPGILIWVFFGVLIGLVVGILPGLGGTATLAILLPVVYTLDPTVALTFLIAIHSSTSQGGVVTSILFGVPGESTTTATMLDGFPMAQQGKAGRALGASQVASMMGAVFGGAVLAVLIPVARPVILAFGAPELFMMAMLGISFVAVLGRGSMIKSFIAAGFGIMLAFVGSHAATGALRYTGGIMYLWQGFDVIPFFMGLFAVPEIIDLAVKGGTIAEVAQAKVGWKDVWEGVKDVFRNWSLVLRCSGMGTAMGLVPGVGGVVSQFICYGHAKQTSKRPQEFGLGCVEGVIAPESGNNAKEEGSLFSALAFGLPSGASMVILLAALTVLGIRPGSEMITKHLDLFWTLVISLVLGNLLASSACLLSARALAKITYIKGTILVPIITILVVLGAYGVANRIEDVFVAFGFGVLGCLMRAYDYSRVTLIIGFVLGDYVERYFLISVASLGPAFIFHSPIAMIMLFIILFGLFGRSGKMASQRFFRHLISKEEEEE